MHRFSRLSSVPRRIRSRLPISPVTARLTSRFGDRRQAFGSCCEARTFLSLLSLTVRLETFLHLPITTLTAKPTRLFLDRRAGHGSAEDHPTAGRRPKHSV